MKKVYSLVLLLLLLVACGNAVTLVAPVYTAQPDTKTYKAGVATLETFVKEYNDRQDNDTLECKLTDIQGYLGQSSEALYYTTHTGAAAHGWDAIAYYFERVGFLVVLETFTTDTIGLAIVAQVPHSTVLNVIVWAECILSPRTPEP